MARTNHEQRARTFRFALAAPTALLLLFFFVWPLVEALILALRGGADGLEALVSPPIVRDFGFSVWTSLASALIAVALGFILVTAMHSASAPLKALTSIIALLPLLVPHIIAAYAIRLALAPAGPILALTVGEDAPNLLITPASLIIALVWKLLPYAYLSAQAARMSLPADLIDAARDLGASPLRRGTKILLPLMAPGLASGGLLVFILAAAQYSITLVVYADKRVTTIPMDVFYLEQANQPGVAATLGLVFAALVVAASLLGERLTRRIGSHA